MLFNIKFIIRNAEATDIKMYNVNVCVDED